MYIYFRIYKYIYIYIPIRDGDSKADKQGGFVGHIASHPTLRGL